MSTREIQGHLEEIYGVEVSPTWTSNVTAAVVEEVRVRQNRPLEAAYPIVYPDALYGKIHDGGHRRRGQRRQLRRRSYQRPGARKHFHAFGQNMASQPQIASVLPLPTNLGTVLSRRIPESGPQFRIAEASRFVVESVETGLYTSAPAGPSPRTGPERSWDVSV